MGNRTKTRRIEPHEVLATVLEPRAFRGRRELLEFLLGEEMCERLRALADVAGGRGTASPIPPFWREARSAADKALQDLAALLEVARHSGNAPVHVVEDPSAGGPRERALARAHLALARAYELVDGDEEGARLDAALEPVLALLREVEEEAFAEADRALSQAVAKLATEADPPARDARELGRGRAA